MGHDTAEWVFVGIVIAILVYVGVDSWIVQKEVEEVPADAETIKVTGQQWFWGFEDAVPGHVNHAWFAPDQTGEFPIQCREYCGLLHYNMRGSLVVEDTP